MINSFYKKRSMKLMVKNGKEHPKEERSRKGGQTILLGIWNGNS